MHRHLILPNASSISVLHHQTTTITKPRQCPHPNQPPTRIHLQWDSIYHRRNQINLSQLRHMDQIKDASASPPNLRSVLSNMSDWTDAGGGRRRCVHTAKILWIGAQSDVTSSWFYRRSKIALRIELWRERRCDRVDLSVTHESRIYCLLSVVFLSRVQ